jgi:hypothetical protein
MTFGLTFQKILALSFLLCSAFLAIEICSPLSQAQLRGSCPALPGDSSGWTGLEHWAWKQICTGRAADLRQYRETADPAEAGHSLTQGDLSQRFLETILLREPWRSSIPRQGVVIEGARFQENVDLRNAKIDHDLKLIGSRFESTALMRNLEIAGELSLQASYFGARSGDGVDLAGAKIHGALSFDDVRSSTNVNMDSLRAGALTLRRGVFRDISLENSRIEGGVDLSDSTSSGTIEFHNMDVGQDLTILNSTLTRMLMQYAKVGGVLDIEGPKSRPEPRPKNFPAQSVDLTGASVGTLRFGSEWYGPINSPQNWGNGSRLSLTNATVQALQDGPCGVANSRCRSNSWPDHLELTGFTYRRLGSSDPGKEDDMAARPAEWWAGWLKKQTPFTPQPYEYLAATLSRLGHKDTAITILYAGKEREREAATFPESVELWLERVFIGYGYRIYYSLFWVVGFVLLGAVMLRLSGVGTANKMPYGVAFSFDMLLPVVRLRDYHYSIDLTGWVRYYFYFHKLMGYVLASFLIASLAGLTK